MISPFEHRAFRWLFVGTASTQVADWLKWMALLWSVYTLTSGLQGVVILCMIGVIARWHGDIWSASMRRSHPLSSRLKNDWLQVLGSSGLIAGVLLQDWLLVYLFVYVTSLLSSLQASRSVRLLPECVPEKHILPASSLLALVAMSAMVAGGLLAAVLLPRLGGAEVLGVALLLQLLSLVCKVLTRKQPAETAQEEPRIGYWQEMLTGLRLVQQQPFFRGFLVFQAVRDFCFGAIVTAVICTVLLKFEGSSGIGIVYALMGLAYPLAGLLLPGVKQGRLGAHPLLFPLTAPMFAMYVALSCFLLWVTSWYAFLPLLFLAHLLHASLHTLFEEVWVRGSQKETQRSFTTLLQGLSRGAQLLGMAVLLLTQIWLG